MPRGTAVYNNSPMNVAEEKWTEQEGEEMNLWALSGMKSRPAGTALHGPGSQGMLAETYTWSSRPFVQTKEASGMLWVLIFLDSNL